MKMNKQQLIDFAHGDPLTEPVLSAVVSRVGDDLEFTMCRLMDGDLGILYKVVATQQDVEFFDRPGIKALIETRVEAIRKQLIKIGEDVTLEQDLKFKS
jgi:hypothetical protein